MLLKIQVFCDVAFPHLWTNNDISKDRSAFISWSCTLSTVTDMATHSRRFESPLFSSLLLSQIISRSTLFKSTEGHKITPPSPGHPVAMFLNTRTLTYYFIFPLSLPLPSTTALQLKGTSFSRYSEPYASPQGTPTFSLNSYLSANQQLRQQTPS